MNTMHEEMERIICLIDYYGVKTLKQENTLVEMECLVCGNHDRCNPDKINICNQCNNGPMIEP